MENHRVIPEEPIILASLVARATMAGIIVRQIATGGACAFTPSTNKRKESLAMRTRSS
jgi:hypothetical protein